MTGSDTSESLFTVGSHVEVRSDEEGFKGAWFRATILQPPPPSPSKKKSKYLVEYNTLVTEDGSHPLTEHVDSAFIRPVPPPQVGPEKLLQVGHVVDADYRDGWWTGVVREVMEEKRRYIVFFENPPDVIEFERDRLRLHADWIEGDIWVTPMKQILGASDSQQEGKHSVKLLPGQNDSKHPEVSEVATQQKTASAVVDNHGSTYSMQNPEEQSSYTRSMKDVVPNRITTDPSSLKKLKDDKVSEATSSVTPRKLRKSPSDKEFPSQIATENIGTRGSQRKRKPALSHLLFQVDSLRGEKKNIATENIGTRGSQRKRKPALSHQLFQVDSLRGEKKNKTNQQKYGEQDNQKHSVKSKGRHSHAGVRNSQEMIVGALPSQDKHKEEGKEGYNVIGSSRNVIQKGNISTEAELPLTTESQVNGNNELLKLLRDPKNTANSQAQEKSTVTSAENGSDSVLDKLLYSLVLFPHMDFKQQPTDASSHKRKRGTPRKLVIISSQDSQGDLQDASRRNIADVPITRSRGIPNEAARTGVKALQNTDDDDQPLSTWFGGMQGPANMDDSSKTVEQNRHARDSNPLDSVGDSFPDENQLMPFVKRSPIWNTIESINVFSLLPQNPHFRPLINCKEEYREGNAIAKMVTFSNLVDKISSLHVDDPTQVFESILESLLDLEKYGFGVSILRGRVNELLSIKQRQIQFEGKSRDVESKMVKQTDEVSKLQDEADSIQKSIIELQEKHASIKAAIVSKESVIASLQLSVDSINESIKNARSVFEKTVSLPLK